MVTRCTFPSVTVRRRAVSRTTWVVIGVGLLLSAVFVVAARVGHVENEERLLQERAATVAAVLEGSIQSVEIPLIQAAAVADVADETTLSAVSAVQRTLQSQVGDDARFVSASVWAAGELEPLLVIGVRPKLSRESADTVRAVLDTAFDIKDQLHVNGLFKGSEPRLGYAVSSSLESSGDVVVYAEQSLPTDRISQTDPGSPFANLDYALYLGSTETPETLVATTSEDLPFTGRHAEEPVEFGDTELLLVMAPAAVLGSRLLQALPWLVGVVGVASTMGAAALIEGIHRRRRDAESLARENERLYEEQHHIAHALQMSLLPARLPQRADLEFAARYVPGGRGTEVGGDWYDVIELNGRVGIVIGDAVGHDVAAATVMAGMRYSAHTLLAQDLAPEEVLNAINRLDRVRGDFVTMACAVFDPRARTLTIANAGHPPPLLVCGADTRHVHSPLGPPIGPFPGVDYEASTVCLPAQGTLLLYTDGLYERRGEEIDVGLERLRAAAARLDGPAEPLLDRLFTDLVGDRIRDDVAMLALRWG